ncbi:hypothetical protein D3C87_1599190 [compost metagenome]
MHEKDRIIENNTVKKVVDGLADFSFSLYAIHYFLIYFIVAMLQKNGYDIRFKDANVENWLLFICAALLLLVVSYLFYWVFEKRTYILRNKMLKWIK